MANDKSMFNFGDDEYDLRNCPTPQLSFGDSDSLNSTDLLSTLDANFDPGLFGEDLINFDDMGESSIANPIVVPAAAAAAAAVIPAQFGQINSPMMPQLVNNNVIQPSPFIHANAYNMIITNESNAFIPIQAGSSREEDNKTPLIVDTGTKNKRQGKCMSRNAVLARQNREKKKNEHNAMSNRMNKLEEENALLRKKLVEYKNNIELLRDRNTYLEAIIQNLPSIQNLVEHMKTFPGNNNNNMINSSSTKKT